MRFHVRRYLFAVFLAPLAVVLLFLGWAIAVGNSLPAPRFSDSPSFNEKARWLHTNIDKGCDVLVIGSSVALNDINEEEMRRAFPGQTILSTASWSLTIQTTSRILERVSALCRPKLILLITYFGDYFEERNKFEIDWNHFDGYLNGGPAILSYIEAPDLFYYIWTRKKLQKWNGSGGRVYESLAFDDTGSVPLECSGFEVDPRRWDGYLSIKDLTSDPPFGELSALSDIGVLAQKMKARLVVAVAPMRQAAEETLSQEALNTLWKSVQGTVESTDGEFIRLPHSVDFPDAMFVDFAHLNRCGSQKYTALLLENREKQH